MRLLASTLLIIGLAGSTFAQDKKAAAPPAEATDVVCGMTVETKTAEKAEYKGKTYYFCSLDDKKEFLKTPDKFVAKADTKSDKKK